MSFVRPSFSQAFLNRRIICSAVSLPRDFTRIIQVTVLSVVRKGSKGLKFRTPPALAGRALDSPILYLIMQILQPGAVATYSRGIEEDGTVDGTVDRTDDHAPGPLPRSGRDGLPAPQPVLPVL